MSCIFWSDVGFGVLMNQFVMFRLRWLHQFVLMNICPMSASYLFAIHEGGDCLQTCQGHLLPCFRNWRWFCLSDTSVWTLPRSSTSVKLTYCWKVIEMLEGVCQGWCDVDYLFVYKYNLSVGLTQLLDIWTDPHLLAFLELSTLTDNDCWRSFLAYLSTWHASPPCLGFKPHLFLSGWYRDSLECNPSPRFFLSPYEMPQTYGMPLTPRTSGHALLDGHGLIFIAGEVDWWWEWCSNWDSEFFTLWPHDFLLLFFEDPTNSTFTMVSPVWNCP